METLSLQLFENQWILSFLFNFILILLTHHLPLLTKKGWIHSGILGTILLGSLGLRGWLSVVVYLFLGSLVTRLGFKYKKKAGLAEAREGRRGPENVWGSAASAAILAILINLNIGDNQLLSLAFASCFAAKLADTFGSEIGKRWGRNTVLISTLRPVKPGTDGAISVEGTFASLLGSSIMVFVMYLFKFVSSFRLVILLIFIGLLATLIESFLGALFQNKYKFLSNEMINFIQTSFAAIITLLLIPLLNS